MMTLPTAKMLLFVGLTLFPTGPHTIYATSVSESYVFHPTDTGWMVEAKGFPSSDFTRNPTREVALGGNNPEDVPRYLRAIAHHSWGRNSMMIFANGDHVEKHGNHAFYIFNAGGANQKIFTILLPSEG